MFVFKKELRGNRLIKWKCLYKNVYMGNTSIYDK